MRGIPKKTKIKVEEIFLYGIVTYKNMVLPYNKRFFPWFMAQQCMLKT
jgi:hypothetical protein